MLATCEHANGVGGMYVYDTYFLGIWAGADICPLLVEKKKRIQRSERYIRKTEENLGKIILSMLVEKRRKTLALALY